jgi:hypothetical protein
VFWWENLREKDHFVDAEDNIKADIQEVGCDGMNWIELVTDGDRWRSLENVVMNLRVL